MRLIISRKYYRLFGLRKYIVVAIHKETKERKQFVAVSRKAQHAIEAVKKKEQMTDYKFTAYTEVQYAHLLKLRY
ncbi:MAG: hypothetical protein KBT36_10770 [Kurthia sp.]|nr:hypothetical protein [Candidatus Kurthia equi]